ncbi:MAG: hypothetical protein E7211_19345, partial [Clostridium lundense]|nr:hypothetical protein [Clostridium lundense]
MKNKTYRFAAALAILLTFCLVFMMPVGAVDVGEANELKTELTAGNPVTLIADITLDLGSGTLKIPGDLNGEAITVPDGKSLTITNGTIELPDSPETLTNLICATEVTKSITLIDVVITGNVTDSIIFVSRVAPGSTDHISLTLDGLTVTTSSKFVYFDVNSIQTIKVTGGTYTAMANCPFILATDVSSNGVFTGVTINSYASVPPKPVVEIAGGLEVTFDECTFTHYYTGDNPDHQYAAAISVSYGGTANIISGDYHGVGLAYGLYVFPSGGTINIHGGNVTSDQGNALYAWRSENPDWDHIYSDPSIINVFGGMIAGIVTHLDTNDGDDGNDIDIDIDADIVINGGTFSVNPSYYVNEDGGYYFYQNEESKYVVTKEIPEPPTATVTQIENPEDLVPPLTFALTFTAVEPSSQQLAYYCDWYADFVLTLNKDITVNADDDTSDGYLAGQYDAWSENWVYVPPVDVTMEANEGLKIMEYAAELMDQPGLKLTYNEVKSFVKEFNCGIFLNETYLKANPDLVVTLELLMEDNEEDDAKKEDPISIGTYTFESPYNVLTFKDRDTVYHTAVLKEGDSISVPANPTRTGYNFVGWSGLPTTMPSSDLTVTADWDAKSYSPRTET